MNKNNAHLYLPFVQALVDGKTLQAKDIEDKWFDLKEIALGGDPEHYRIKPEPRKWTVWLVDDDYIVHEKTIGKIYPGYKMIEVIEVTETLPENEQ
jgi:hypothetical protein